MTNQERQTKELPSDLLQTLFDRYANELRNPTADHLKPDFQPDEPVRPRRHTAMARALESLPVRPLPAAAGRTWIWSDLHLGHDRVIEYSSRPYPDAGTMNEALLTAWEDTAGEQDLTVVLGDVCMASALNEEVFARIAAVPGRKILVPGNHDFTGAGRLRVRGFDEVCAMLYRAAAPGEPPLLLTHVPVPALPEGWINVHGHWHDTNTHSARHINVSVEQLGFVPAPFERIAALAAALPRERVYRGTTLARARAAGATPGAPAPQPQGAMA